MDAGAEVFINKNNVFLTKGLYESGTNICIGIPPEFIQGVVDLNTGHPVTPLPVQRIVRNGADAGGRPEGASEIVAEAVVSQEEAERIRRQVGFSFEDESEDLRALERRTDLCRRWPRRNSDVEMTSIVVEGEQPPSSSWDRPQPCEPSPEPAAGADFENDPDMPGLETDNSDAEWDWTAPSTNNEVDPWGSYNAFKRTEKE